MPREKSSFAPSTQLLFISSWKEVWNQLRAYCEEYWKFFCLEQQRDSTDNVDASTPGGVIYWRNAFQERHGNNAPLKVAAAAVFRREFVRLTAVALPESGITLPDDDDPTEIAIVSSPDWNSAVNTALMDVEAVKRAIQNVRPEWDVNVRSEPAVFLNYLQKEYESRLTKFEQLTQLERHELSFQPLAGLSLTPIPSDPIFRIVLEALMYGQIRMFSAEDLKPISINLTTWLGPIFDTGEPGLERIIGVIGFTDKVESQYKYLMSNRSLALKTHFALWARAYAETTVTPDKYLTVSLSQFCDDLGYIRKNGAHRSMNKAAAVSMLDLLMSIEIVGFSYSQQTKALREINGYIWKRGAITTSLQGYQDVFQSAIDPHIEGWNPKAFSYAPGNCWSTNISQRSPFLVSSILSLLRLSTENKHKYAVILGAYLFTLPRKNGAIPRSVKIQDVLKAIGLWDTPELQKNPGRVEEHLACALGDIRDAGLIEAWRYSKSPLREGSSSGAEHRGRYKDWYRGAIVIRWPKHF